MSDDANSEQSRSERLRERRSQRTESHSDATGSDPNERTADDDATESTASSASTDESSTPAGTVKDEQVGTYMYIPQTQNKEIQRLYNVLKAEYEYEFETSFEKNRHFYPLLIQYGLDSLDGLDAMEIQDRLDSI